MLKPFDVIDCSWPRPVQHTGGRWTSPAGWENAKMPVSPQPEWRVIDGVPCWAIDWRTFFNGGLVAWDGKCRGEMWGFHVVFRIRVAATGRLTFWSDDGCIVRRDGSV